MSDYIPKWWRLHSDKKLKQAKTNLDKVWSTCWWIIEDIKERRGNLGYNFKENQVKNDPKFYGALAIQNLELAMECIMHAKSHLNKVSELVEDDIRDFIREISGKECEDNDPFETKE